MALRPPAERGIRAARAHSAQWGSKYEKKPAIRAEIDRRLREASQDAKVTVEKILRDLEITFIRASEDRKYSAAIRCLELQGKYLKMFSERIEHVEILEKVSTERLVELARKIAERGKIDLSGIFSTDKAA